VRKYLRHPVGIPIEFSISDRSIKKSTTTDNISICGLCFISKDSIEKDKIIIIKIPLIRPNFELQGRVVRCKRKNGHVEIGVEFIDQSDIYHTRMIEQVCHIKQYQKDVAEKEGRNLTDGQAAREWISNHAAQFPK